MADPFGCAACGERFGTLTLFDRHQQVSYGQRPPVVCAEPGSLGMVRDRYGTWQTPEGLARRQRDAEQLSRAVARRKRRGHVR